MIDKNVYSKEYIDKTSKIYKVDPTILERCIFAFGLLEAMVRSKADFIFKGGTSLMLLLSKPFRLSTDIDIIARPGTDILSYVKQASQIYPFTRYEEDVRKGINGIVKKHFRFYYKSLSDERKEISILLDVLFEENHYSKLLKKEIKTEILKTSGEAVFVCVPNQNSILGDKLTAFAPNTIGVQPFFKKDNGSIIDKRIETIKQFFDVASLYDAMDDFEEVCTTYRKTAESEIRYRGLDITYNDCLEDSFKEAMSILTKGLLFPNNYPLYLFGIRGLNNFLINVSFNAENAYKQAAKVMYLTACILSNNSPKKEFEPHDLLEGKYNKINKLKKYAGVSFDIAANAIDLYNQYIFDEHKTIN